MTADVISWPVRANCLPDDCGHTWRAAIAGTDRPQFLECPACRRMTGVLVDVRVQCGACGNDAFHLTGRGLSCTKCADALAFPE